MHLFLHSARLDRAAGGKGRHSIRKPIAASYDSCNSGPCLSSNVQSFLELKQELSMYASIASCSGISMVPEIQQHDTGLPLNKDNTEFKFCTNVQHRLFKCRT